MKLKGKVAIVTGASGEIGRAVISALRREGMLLMLQYHSRVEELERMLNSLPGPRSEMLTMHVDFSDPPKAETQMVSLVEETVRRFGRIDVLINLAGRTSDGLWMKPMTQYSIDEFMSIFNIDVMGTFLTCKHVVPEMQKQGSGVIVNMSGNSAVGGAEFGFGWIVSKSAILGITKSLARELGPSIRVNAMAPGYFDTKWVREGATLEEIETAKNSASLKRMGQPEEIAKLVIFLVSDDSSFMTGQTLVLDGGTVIR